MSQDWTEWQKRWVTSREGRVSRNTTNAVRFSSRSVTSREGRVSRNVV